MMKTSLIQLMFFYLLANYLNYVAFDEALALLGCLIETKNKKKTKKHNIPEATFQSCSKNVKK